MHRPARVTPPPATAATAATTGRSPRLPLLALATGAFAIGTTEFLMMGLLPQVAADLGVSVPAVGYAISAYALGVVVGAPTLTALALRHPAQRVLVALMLLFVLGHVAIALAPGYQALLAARFATGLAHGSFFGVGAVVARSLVPRERAARAIALVFTGLTVANVVGVPLGTALGQALGWRWAFAAVAVLGLATAAALVAWVPVQRAARGGLSRELGAFRRPQVLLALAVTAIGTGGLFAVYSYVAEILGRLSGYSPGAVVWVLVAYGAGTTAGTLLGGRLGDRWPLGAVVASMVAMVAACLALAALASSPVAAVLVLTALGLVSFAGGPPLVNRVITASGGAGLLVSAANQGAFNLANALGAALGAQALSLGYGYRAPVVVGAALAAAGAVLAVVALVAERTGAAPLVLPGDGPPGAGDRADDRADDRAGAAAGDEDTAAALTAGGRQAELVAR